jgi:hypothetical protein
MPIDQSLLKELTHHFSAADQPDICPVICVSILATCLACRNNFNLLFLALRQQVRKNIAIPGNSGPESSALLLFRPITATSTDSKNSFMP